MSPARSAVALFAVAVAGACADDPFSPPEGTERFDPPDAYRAQWAIVEDCSGLRGPFERVRWYRIPTWSFACPEGNGVRECFGLWEEPHNIYLGTFAAGNLNGDYFTVRHEILHDLLGPGQGHPPVFEKCGLIRAFNQP